MMITFTRTTYPRISLYSTVQPVSPQIRLTRTEFNISELLNSQLTLLNIRLVYVSVSNRSGPTEFGFSWTFQPSINPNPPVQNPLVIIVSTPLNPIYTSPVESSSCKNAHKTLKLASYKSQPETSLLEPSRIILAVASSVCGLVISSDVITTIG